ncbi:hypothetical protein MJO28_017089 [Puccinia striiformis f. sp. tritici]|nr:hypothetical protein MJO28_017089 [Puccinia striiformis f. sp. tritici]
MENLTEASKRYDAQELIPSAKDMIKKLRGYFDSAIAKPVYICSTLLDPRIKTNILTPEVIDLMKVSKQTILNNFKSEAERYVNNRYSTNYEIQEPDQAAPKNTLKSSLFKKKKQKIGLLDDEIEAPLINPLLGIIERLFNFA